MAMKTTGQSKWTGAARFAAVVMLLGAAATGFAGIVNRGFFEGADLRPLFSADSALPEKEPAAVLVFTPDTANFDLLSRFDQWANTPGKSYARFGVVVAVGDQSRAVVEEMLIQRGVKVPIFFTRTAFTASGKARLVVLDKGTARDIAGQDLAELEKAATEAASASGAVAPAGIETTGATATSPNTAATSVPAGKGVAYRNERHKFSIRFPEGWKAEEAPNGAGAKGQAPRPDLTLDMRAYGTANVTAPDGAEGRMTAEEFFDGFRGRMLRRGLTNIKVTGRFEIKDGESVGREYEYTFVQPEGGEFQTDESGTGRGRLQVFEAGSAFKIALVEGAAGEFEANKQAIDEFLESFHPY
jgi:hypothetical protein